jgi:hypothetical protein
VDRSAGPAGACLKLPGCTCAVRGFPRCCHPPLTPCAHPHRENEKVESGSAGQTARRSQCSSMHSISLGDKGVSAWRTDDEIALGYQFAMCRLVAKWTDPAIFHDALHGGSGGEDRYFAALRRRRQHRLIEIKCLNRAKIPKGKWRATTPPSVSLGHTYSHTFSSLHSTPTRLKGHTDRLWLNGNSPRAGAVPWKPRWNIPLGSRACAPRTRTNRTTGHDRVPTQTGFVARRNLPRDRWPMLHFGHVVGCFHPSLPSPRRIRDLA